MRLLLSERLDESALTMPLASHAAVYDYQDDATEPRHGTRVSSLAEKPYLDPKSKGRREALGLDMGHLDELGGGNPFRGSR